MMPQPAEHRVQLYPRNHDYDWRGKPPPYPDTRGSTLPTYSEYRPFLDPRRFMAWALPAPTPTHAATTAVGGGGELIDGVTQQSNTIRSELIDMKDGLVASMGELQSGLKTDIAALQSKVDVDVAKSTAKLTDGAAALAAKVDASVKSLPVAGIWCSSGRRRLPSSYWHAENG